MKPYKVCILLLATALCALASFGQSLPEKLKAQIHASALPGLQYPNEVRAFYQHNNYNYSWLDEQHRSDLRQLLVYTGNAALLGLQQTDYHPELCHAWLAGERVHDSVSAELQFTDAALHWLHDLLQGNKTESLGYDGLKYQPGCYDLPLLLNTYLLSGRFALLLAEQELKDPAYTAVRSRLSSLVTVVSAPGFKDVAVTSNKVSNSNPALVSRLQQWGFVPADSSKPSDALLKVKLKEAQNLFGLLNDGALRSTTLQALNVPLRQRVGELENALNAMRWLHCIKQEQHVAIVNLPSASLLLYEHGNLVLTSRLIVGKQSTPTPTLSSTITEVILYPYWNVPYKIATRELLPIIKRNRGYLAANNYQVLNSSGKVVNPENINWHSLGPSNFPYTIRQSTGCDNALGLVKLNFYNPFSVYLHDTPNKFLFSMNKRYFSHGCMRLEKAMELGRYIMRGNTLALDTLSEKGCLRNQAPITVPATEKIPVFVVYHTAWINADGELRFYEDVYRKIK